MFPDSHVQNFSHLTAGKEKSVAERTSLPHLMGSRPPHANQPYSSDHASMGSKLSAASAMGRSSESRQSCFAKARTGQHTRLCLPGAGAKKTAEHSAGTPGHGLISNPMACCCPCAQDSGLCWHGACSPKRILDASTLTS